MQRSRIYVMVFLLVAVLGAIMALKAMSGRDRGGDDADRPAAVQIEMVSDRPAAGSGGEAGGSAPTGGAAAADASGVAVSLVGGDEAAVGQDGAGGGAGGATRGGPGRDGDAGELPPMAALGASQGIHTKMDSSWFPDREAAEWFAPLEQDFQASRPLTPERYKDILGNHHERIGDVLQRSAEIGDTSSPEEGIAFLEAWNALVDGYKAEAYGP